MFLLGSRPLTRRQIMERSGLYVGDGDAPRAMFERDKRELRRVGVPILTDIAEGDEGATRYTIDRSDYELPDLDLAPDEQLALSLASAAVQFGTNWDEQAMHKLGGSSSPTPLLLVAVPVLSNLPSLYSAVRDRAVASFEYSNKSRKVEPQGFLFERGHWYLDALDGEIRKTFRVDRIAGDVSVGDPNAFDLLDTKTVDAYRKWEPTGDSEGFEAVILIDAQRAPHARRYRAATVSKENEDGSIVVTVKGSNREALRSWVLGLRDHAEILEPAELRDDIRDWLASIVEAS